MNWECGAGLEARTFSEEFAPMYVCLCKGITESDVRKLGCAGFLHPDLLAVTLGIDEESCCGRCARNIQELVALAASETEALHLTAGARSIREA